MSNDFIGYASLLWRARRFVFKTVIAGAVASLIVAFLLPKSYQSTVRLMPPGQGSEASSLLAEMATGPAADVASEALGLEDPSAIYVQVLQSRTVQDHLIDRFDLRRVYHTKTYKDARLVLTAMTEIANDRKSGVVSLMVTASTPELAAKLGKGYFEELNTLMVQLDTSAAHRKRVFLENRLKGVQSDLQNISTQLAEYSSKNAVMGEEQNKAVFGSAEELRGHAIEAKAELLALEQAYKPDNERVRVAQARVDEFDRQLAKMQGSGGPMEISADGFPTIREMPLLGVKYASLFRDLTVEEGVYAALTKQYEMARVDEARDLPTVRVLDEADVPEKKSSPKRSLVLLAGTFLSFILSCAYVLGQDWWRNSRSPWRHFGREVAEGLAVDVSPLPRFFGRKKADRSLIRS